jgi:hypothetical protein
MRMAHIEANETYLVIEIKIAQIPKAINPIQGLNAKIIPANVITPFPPIYGFNVL